MPLQTRRKALISAMCLCMLGAVNLSACGIKPSSVSPPEDVKEDRFPRTYPNTAHDPVPVPAMPVTR